MYKIYINQKPLILISDKQVEIFKDKEEILLARYPGKAKFLLNYIDMLEKGKKNMQVVLYDHDINKLYRDLKTIASPVKAAGGIVFNESKELLAIFRKGYWDLPKGHIHRNEKKKDAAIREVMEETGVKDLEISAKAGKTYHIYRNKKRHLKISHWYYMHTYKQELKPQIEEDISKAIWVDSKEFLDSYEMYASIMELLQNI